MHENYISRATVMSWLLWSAVCLMVGSVWALSLLHMSPDVTRAVAITAILAMAVAIAWQVRIYVTRLCELIRLTAGLEDAPDGIRHISGSKRAR